MWEFSLNLQAENFTLAKTIYNSLKEFSAVTGGIITSHEENGYIYILIAVSLSRQSEMERFLAKIITQIICSHYKEVFLNEHLSLPEQDKIGLIAFKKALLNFDRETDHYMIQKNLTFDRSLFLESFYHFKLKNLRAKWLELVTLANENKEYLISIDAFIDLLKFLVDNLDICENEIDVVEEKEGYKILLSSGDYGANNKPLTQEGLVGCLIDLAPQKINLYCLDQNRATLLLEKIFDQRIKIHQSATLTIDQVKLRNKHLPS